MSDTCPKCNNETLEFGYGLAGGGIGSYTYCTTTGCNHFDKTQDPEIGADPNEQLCPLMKRLNKETL